MWDIPSPLFPEHRVHCIEGGASIGVVATTNSPHVFADLVTYTPVAVTVFQVDNAHG